MAAVLTLLFAFAMIVNLNDPDALRWILLYGAATAAAAWYALSPRGVPWAVPALVALVAAVWAATYAPRVIGHVGFGDLWSAWEMKNTRIEEGREFYGLCIVAATLALLAAARQRRPKA